MQKITEEQIHKCIYCKSKGPFNKEHVFPYSLGGDDPNYMLVNLVCVQCNSGLFSKFEATLARRSMAGFIRVFQQQNGRKKDSKPKFDPVEAHVIDKNGQLLESGYRDGFEVEIYPQIIFDGGALKPTGPDSKQFQAFTKQLEEIFATDIVLIIEKENHKNTNTFKITTMQILNNTYNSISLEIKAKPPKHGIWLQHTNETASEEKPLRPRIFRKFEGQIVLKTSSTSSTVGDLLWQLQKALPDIQSPNAETRIEIIENPCVSTTTETWSDDCSRAVAKIGFNVLAYYLGTNTAKHSAFRNIKRSILNGHPRIPNPLIDKNSIAPVIFGEPPIDHHCMILTPIPAAKNKISIVFLVLIYGQICARITLAEKAPKSMINAPIYFLVDHINNKLRKVELVDYQRKYNKKEINELSIQYTLRDMKADYTSHGYRL